MGADQSDCAPALNYEWPKRQCRGPVIIGLAGHGQTARHFTELIGAVATGRALHHVGEPPKGGPVRLLVHHGSLVHENDALGRWRTVLIAERWRRAVGGGSCFEADTSHPG